MPRRSGIALADLFAATDQINSALPQVVQDFIDRFSVVDYRATRSPGAIIHHGKIQSIDDAFPSDVEEFDVGIGTLSLPLIHGGLPFQLSMTRAAIAGNLEPAADAWQLNIYLADFALTLPQLEAAIYVPEGGAVPRHLLRDPNNKKVRIIGAAVLRIQKRAGANDVDIVFVDQPDPLDPTLPSGGVASLTFSPPHFFIGSSEFGMSVGQLLFDFSESYSPPQVLELNQGPGWVGLAIREATFYAPRNLPVIGDLSGGVKDVLLGRPMGIQGELEIQFGRTALDPSTFQFKQDPSGPDLPVSGAGAARIVTLSGGQDEDLTIHAGFTSPAPPADVPAGATQEWTAIWAFDGAAGTEGDAAASVIRHGSVLRVQPIEILTIDGQETRFNHPPVTFRFVAAGEAPSVSATIGAESFANVVHLGGAAADIGTVTLQANSTAPGTSTFTWEFPDRGVTATGNTFTPDVGDLTGQHNIALKEQVEGEETRRVTHIRLRIVDEGRLLVGTEGGVFDATDDATPLELSAVEATYDLSDFHATGALNTKTEQATLNPGAAANVDVPADGLAQVTISDSAPAPVIHDRHVQVLMRFEEDEVVGWGPLRPAAAAAAGNEADLQIQLLQWAANYPGADFLAIGRCDDIGQDVPGEDPDSFNIGLAKDRAAKGRALLTSLSPGATGTLIDNARVYTRGETSAWDAGSTNGDTLEEDVTIQPAPTVPDGITPAGKSEAVGDAALAKGWLIKHENAEHTGWRNAPNTDAETLRQTYRRVDIFAVGGAPTAGAVRATGEPERAPTLRRSMVPSGDRTPAAVTPAASNIDYRVKLVVRWDSPTATEWSDAVPTLAEAEFAWTPAEAPLPEIGGGPVPTSMAREVLTVYAKWSHDVRTGFTRTTLGIRSDGDPDGLISTDQPNLTAALAFGPMLLSGVDFENDVVGSGARVAALLGAAAFATVDLGGGPLVGAGSKTALIGAEAEAQTRSLADPLEDYQIKLTVEYVTTLHINGGVLGIRTAAARPVKIRYKQVGIEYDSSKTGWDQIGLAYDTSSMEIEDGGQWMIDGVLGELLRIVEISLGRGSLWIEGRIAIAISIGVIEISEAIIRLTFVDGDPIPKFELRGFVLKADIPNVLKGEGRLRIEDGGIIRAGVEADIIPLGLGADAAIAFGKPPEIDPDVFLSLFLGVQFSTPLPLAQSGAAIYGFKGLFGMNAGRKLPANPDPVGRELDWWSTPPENKYQPERDQYALGVGVVVGTMPDVSFCFSASGMVVVAFPDPEVILGVDVKVIEVPNTQVTDDGSPEGAITGLIVIDTEAVTVAVSAQYEIPKVLKLKVPFGAYFPYSGNGVYVRLGSDGQTAFGRFGEPITITFLPGTLDVKVWSYLMIEQAGLPSLGGDPRFSFDGFSVGFGAGWGIDWSAGPIKLSASAKVLVGFGTKPLLIKGGVFVQGELDLVVVSISARGELILTYLDNDIHLEGEFCGEVDLFFFSIKGCVGVEIGGALNEGDPPAPEPPIAAISLVDRRDRIMGAAVPTSQAIKAEPVFAVTESGGNSGKSPQDNNTVWPDTAPVIHFTHYVKNGTTAASASGQFDVSTTPTQPIWFGGNRLKYTYRLDDVILRRKRDGQVVASLSGDPLQSVWMTTPYRNPDSSGSDNPLPSEHEGPNLKLLDWDPWTWVKNMTDGGESADGDPVDEIEDICDPIPQPRRACVFGRAAMGAGWYAVHLRQETPAEPPYPSRFSAVGEPVIRLGGLKIEDRDLQTLFTTVGGSILPGVVTNLPFAVAHDGETLTRGYLLPRARRASPAGMQRVPLPWEAMFDRELARPVVRLLVCDLPGGNGGGRKDCTEFQDWEPDGKHVSLVHRDISVSAVDQSAPFTLTDRVNTNPEPDGLGSDGKADILFPPEGIDIRFRMPCTQVELHFISLTDAEIKTTAFAPSGAQVDQDVVSGPQGRPVVARLNHADGIARVVVTGGGASLLYRICCVKPADQPTPDPGTEKDCESFRSLKPSPRGTKGFSFNGFAFRTLDQNAEMRIGDAVNQAVNPPVPGQDQSGDIQFPSSGIEISLPHPCPTVELWVMQFNPEPVRAVGFNAAGKDIAVATTPGQERVPHRLLLAAPPGEAITHVRLTGGGFESILFRICCLDAAGGVREDCAPFQRLKIEGGGKRATIGGLVFTDMSGGGRLRALDQVDARPDPAIAGRDGVPELLFAEKGLRIDLPKACEHVTVRLMLFAGPVKGQALNGLGARIAKAETTDQQKVEQTLVFEGPGIVAIELFGGDNEALVYEVCCTMRGDAPTQTPIDDVIANPLDNAAVRVLDTLPRVRGIIDDQLADTWPGRVIETREGPNGVCRVIQYEPGRTARGPWNGFQVLSPLGKNVTFLSVCGVDQIMVDARNEDEEARQDRQDDIGDILMTPVNERREVLLEPGEDYEIVAPWSWQFWRSNEDGTDAPPSAGGIDETEWRSGGTLVYHFAVAEEATDTGNTQDGLNEYVFDPRDVNRNLTALEPADGRAVHFTDDPIWAHFDAGHMEQLLEQYGRELVIEVKRTDPPPQSTPAALAAVLAPLIGTFTWHTGPDALQKIGVVRINDAILEAPCLPDGSVGGGSLEGRFELEPNAMYDFNLLAPRAGSGDDPAVVSATRFTTSRYANPRAFMTALGFGDGAASPYRPDDIILPDAAILPTGALETSDSLLDLLLEEMEADTLPLPTRKAVAYAAWRQTPGGWRLEGFLIDSLETMNRVATVVTAAGTELGVRCKLARATVGGTDFTPIRANANWTRVFLKPPAPVALTEGRHELRLDFETSSGTVAGLRSLGHQPALIEREGF